MPVLYATQHELRHMQCTILFRCVYLLYTSEYTVHKKKKIKIPAKFNQCMYTYTLSPEWFDYKMFSSAKEKKRDLYIAT